jgi:hypothetical protein
MSIRRLVLPVLSLAALVLSCADTATAAPPPSLRYLPKVLKYDELQDSFTYTSSVAGGQGWRRPGGEQCYSGNRLEQFRYVGPARRGGIYDAIRYYNEGQDLDPAQYRYRR